MSKIDYTLKVAGVSFYQDAILKLYKSNKEFNPQKLKLVREPTNPFDKNAIQVVYGDEKLGYIPKLYSKTFADKMDNGRVLELEFIAWNVPSSEYVRNVGITIRVKEI